MSLPFARDDLAAVLDEASAIVRRGRLSAGSVEWKGDGSPVTAIDRDVDRFLHAELTRLAPEAGWLSEESPDDGERLGRALTWIVDPIDGTKELVAGRDEVAVSIGLVRDGRVVAAAVANPLRAERGVWSEGGPARFDGLAPRARASSLAGAVAIVSRTESAEGDLRGLDRICGQTRPVGSVAYKLLRVAAGADDLAYSVRPKHEWDLCGGAGLVRSSGGEVLRLDGEELRFNRADTRIPVGHVAGPEALARAARDELLLRLARR